MGDGRHFEQAESWAVDTRMREARSVRLAWIVAGVLAAVALLEAVALALMAPLKTVQPITILVDRQTGFVQALDPATPRRIQADAALTTSMLAQYVSAREGFDHATVAHDYARVALWSTGTARARYLATMPATSPESPFQRYPAGSMVAARVKSVSPLSAGTALVRFDTRLQDRSGRLSEAQPWVAIVRYRYTTAPMSFENRLTNPLGFQVTDYRRDPEAPVGDPPAATMSVDAPRAAAGRVRPVIVPEALPASLPASLRGRGLSLSQIPLGSPLTPPERAAGVRSVSG